MKTTKNLFHAGLLFGGLAALVGCSELKLPKSVEYAAEMTKEDIQEEVRMRLIDCKEDIEGVIRVEFSSLVYRTIQTEKNGKRGYLCICMPDKHKGIDAPYALLPIDNTEKAQELIKATNDTKAIQFLGFAIPPRGPFRATAIKVNGHYVATSLLLPNGHDLYNEIKYIKDTSQ